jgi:hypothetical protein
VTAGRHLERDSVTGIDLRALRSLLTCVVVLLAFGISPPPPGQGIPCPLPGHGGDRSSRSFRVHDRYVKCWTHCGRLGPIDLWMALAGCDFATAVKQCAALVGLRGKQISRDQLYREVLRRDQFAEEVEAARRAWREAWRKALRDLRFAQGDVTIVAALVRDDPDESLPSTKALLDELGDPYLRTQLAQVALEKVERGWRAFETAHGRSPRVAALLALQQRWWKEDAIASAGEVA